MKLAAHLNLVQGLRMPGGIPAVPPYVFMLCYNFALLQVQRIKALFRLSLLYTALDFNDTLPIAFKICNL
jgi:hypothetical protein